VLNAADDVLLVYLEPTTYILGLVAELKKACAASLHVWFLNENASQDWKLDLPECCRIADETTPELMRAIVGLSGRGSLRLIHLGGWGGDKRLPCLILTAWLRGIPLFVETDTQKPFEEVSWKRVLKRLAYPVLFRVPTRFLPGGTRQAQYLRSFGVQEDRIRVAQMTVDVAAITRFAETFDSRRRKEWRDALGVGPADTLFLFVGRLVDREKAITPLLAAFGRLAGRDPGARLAIVGDGPMRGPIDRCAKSGRWAIPLGRLQGEELFSAYCGADALVLPSRFESWGLVINEAMAAGLPVIVSNRVGCADDLVEGRGTGIVYDYARADGLFDALATLSGDAVARDRMSRKARSVISSWTLEAEAARVVDSWVGAT
jgi:glycosyltransferase involved in cell wall biosynthesis